MTKESNRRDRRTRRRTFTLRSPRAQRLLLGSAACLLLSTIVRTDDPVSSNVRYTGEIVRIFDRKCAPCHGAGGLAVPLSSYREVRDWGRAIREEIVEQRMPPWTAARGYARVRNDLGLTAREATTILSWLDGGMPRGDDRDLPRPPAATRVDPPDVHLPLPAQRVPALEEHFVARVTVATNLSDPRQVARVVVTPGNRGVLRGALVYADTGGSTAWVGAWLPWQQDVAPPSPHAFTLPAGARLTVELHYRGDEEPVEDRPSLELYFAGPSSTAGATPTVGELAVATGSPARLGAATKIWAIQPSADDGTRSLELTVRRPNGAAEVLMWMPEYRRDWPQALVLQDPILLPAGTTVTLAAEPATASASARLSVLK